jgi:O-antigen/teichoic acid export membrane protein
VKAFKQTNRSAGGRLAVITVDQVISGASNVLIAILAARLLSASGFGLFGIVFLIYMILVGVTRALVSDPLLVHPVESRERPGEAIGTGCVLATILAIGLLVVGLGIRFWQQTLGDGMIVLAACLPLLVLQDLGRYLGFATQRPAKALVLDSVWLVVMLPAVAALFISGTHSLPWLVAAWGGSGAIASLLVFAWYRVRDVRLGLGWLRETWGLSWRYLVWYTAMQSSALGLSSLVGGIAGAEALGGVQGTLVLVRPFTTFQVASVTATIGEVARAAGDRRRIWRHVGLGSGMTAGVAAVNLAIMLALPTPVGKLVLGASWHHAQPLLLPAGLQILCAGLLNGPLGGLLGVRAMSKVTRISVANTGVMLAAAACGAVLDGARGGLWAVALTQGFMVIVWWVAFTRHLGRSAQSVGVEAPAIGLGSLLKEPASAPAAIRPSAPAAVRPASPSPYRSASPAAATGIGLAALLDEVAAPASAAKRAAAAARWLPPEVVGSI